MIRVYKIISSIVSLLFITPLHASITTNTKFLALNGDLNSQIKLGVFFQSGDSKDLQESYYWMKMAAKQNSHIAIRYVGRAHLFGYGTSKNIYLAQDWFLSAANQGDPLAMNELGKYFESEGKWLQSSAWFSLAYEFGCVEANRSFERISISIKNQDKLKFSNIVKSLKSSIHGHKNPTIAATIFLPKTVDIVLLGNGISYWGQTYNGLAHGYGKKKLEEATTYQGEFVMGLEHGYGTSFGKDGKISFQGLWKEGVPFIQKKETREGFTNY